MCHLKSYSFDFNKEAFHVGLSFFRAAIVIGRVCVCVRNTERFVLNGSFMRRDILAPHENSENPIKKSGCPFNRDETHITVCLHAYAENAATRPCLRMQRGSSIRAVLDHLTIIHIVVTV